MIKVKVGSLVIEMPESFVHEGDTVELASSDLHPVYAEHSMPDDDPIGYNLSYEAVGQGSVVNGITQNMWGEVVVYDGPLDEPEEYEHFDDAPFDTHFTPPSTFIDDISLYHEEDEFDEDEEDEEE